MNISDVIAIITFFLGLIATYFLGRRSLQVPDIRYAIDFSVILDPDDPLLDQNLKMTIGSHAISSISRTRIALWNQRGATVRAADIVDSDPLRLKFAEGDTPLQARTLCSSREQIKMTSSINSVSPGSVGITFDFLDAKDGAIFEIVHQGTTEPELVGTLRGANKRRNRSAELNVKALAEFARRSRYRRIPKGAVALVGYLGGAVIATAIAILLVFFYHYPPASLVNAKEFNLNSMHGQANFANAVFNSNNPYASSDAQGFLTAITIFIDCALIFLAIDAFRSFLRRRIPYNIAKWNA